MKALLICPEQCPGITVLTEMAPLANLPLLGKSYAEYWIEHLALLGAKEILLLTTDRPEAVRAKIGNGARWGLRSSVHLEKSELTLEEARLKYQEDADIWLPPPHDINVMNHLPGLPLGPLISSYADWFAGVRALLPLALTPDRIGVHEIQAGVWAGLNTHIDPSAKLIGPVWIGEGAWIEAGTTIGPHAVLEREVFIGRGAEISNSVIGPETFVGKCTEIRNSLAWGSVLINWERDSHVRVPDAFLLCSRKTAPASRSFTTARALLRLRELLRHAPAAPISGFTSPP